MSTASTNTKTAIRRGAYGETRIVATLQGQLVAVLVEREDGLCTVFRAGVWHTFGGEPEEWPTRQEAMEAVEVAIGAAVAWDEMAHTRGRTERRTHELHCL